MPLGLGEGSFFASPKVFGSRVTVRERLFIADGSVTQPSMTWSSDTDSGFYKGVVNGLALTANGVQTAYLGGTASLCTLLSGGIFGIGNDLGSPDARLYRDDADIWAQRRLTAAQTFRIYNTYTNDSNYERTALGWSGNVFTIAPAAAGTGTLRGMVLGSSDGSLAFFGGTPVTKPTAYTQTYATADKTHAARLAGAVDATGATNVAPWGYASEAQANDIITQLNNLRNDQLDTAQIVNSLIDDLQALALVG